MPERKDHQHAIRAAAMARRQLQPDKDRLSRAILRHVMQLPQYTAARTVLFYLDVRSEVRTLATLETVLPGATRIVVPYCVENHLELFQLESLDELDTGKFGILEPRMELRGLRGKHVQEQAIDLALVPGVAFDRRGGRLGHGFGYYDRLLGKLRPDAWLVGLAFECQMVESIPLAQHDVVMNCVVTEKAVYLPH